MNSFVEEEDLDARPQHRRFMDDVSMQDLEHERSQGNQSEMVDELGFQQESLGHFDEFGQFRYKRIDVGKGSQSKAMKTIELKDLTEQNFLDLLDAKNQDKRFYGWLHFHPLFDEEDWDSDDKLAKDYYQNRRGSEQMNLKPNNLLTSDKGSPKQQVEADPELDFFQEMYAGISTLFEAEDHEPLKEDRPQPYGFLHATEN